MTDDLPPPARAALDRCLPLLPDAAQAQGDLRRLLGDEATAAWPRLVDDLAVFLRLAAVSRYAADRALADPEGFWALVDRHAHRQVWGRRTLRTTSPWAPRTTA